MTRTCHNVPNVQSTFPPQFGAEFGSDAMIARRVRDAEVSIVSGPGDAAQSLSGDSTQVVVFSGPDISTLSAAEPVERNGL